MVCPFELSLDASLYAGCDRMLIIIMFLIQGFI